MDNHILEYYIKEYATENFLINNGQSTSRFFHEVCMNMDKDMGQGWSAILRIHNGLCVTLADYRLSRQMKICHTNMQTPFQLNILLSGNFECWIPGQKKQRVTAGEVWLFCGSFEQASFTYFPNENICGLSIALPRDLLDFWLGNSCCSTSNRLEKLIVGGAGSIFRGQPIPLARGLRQSSECVRTARELVYARRRTFADNLRFESLALDLLFRILTLKDASASSYVERIRKVKTTVDEAVDILRQEWNDPPSISALARRVRVNESYLKAWFREHIGMTIGAYIREQRMKKALELIESGRYSVLGAAVFVGYSNPSHFSAAFKKFYGHLPSYYLPRVDNTL